MSSGDSGFKLNWKGKQVAENVDKAAMVGVNRTTGNCVTSAKGLVHVDTTLLQGSLRLEPARLEGHVAIGRWGSFDVGYALWQEVLPAERGGKAYLRPAADEHYPNLGKEIKAALV